MLKTYIASIFVVLFVGTAFTADKKAIDISLELKKSQAETRVLQKLLDSGKNIAANPQANSCSGATPCCCRAGSYGYCTTTKECEEVAAPNSCTTSSTAGC